MARLSTCKDCGKKILSEEKKTHAGKTYCNDCYEKIEIEKQDYKTLIQTICEYFNLDVPTGFIVKQIKQYKDEFKYTYAGITYTLWYVKTIENKSFDETKYGIALVKYYYEKAKEYFLQQQRISESIQEVDNKTEKIKEVKVNLNKVYSKKNEFLVDIKDLIGGNGD